MLYIVSGFMRSGTSMMMKALTAGGMDSAYSRERDKRMNEQWGDDDTPGYTVNDEYYELEARDYRDPDFPKPFDGKLIKCLFGGLLSVPPCEARVVFMRRPRAEVGKSMIAAFGHTGEIASKYDFDAIMDRMVAIARDRRSFVSVDEVWYQDALTDPLSVFESLKANGWPIDAAAAAAIPSPERKRYASDDDGAGEKEDASHQDLSSGW